MKLSQFIDATKDHDPDAEIVIAVGCDVANGPSKDSLIFHEKLTHTAKVWSMADTKDAIVLEL